jgi:tetratricopeptide (TPR) repeat protein
LPTLTADRRFAICRFFASVVGLFAVSLGAWTAGALAEDIIYLKPGGEASGRVTLRGTILDYTGEAITIDRSPAPPRRYPAERVLGFETEWNSAHQAAQAALAERDYSTAARQLADANRVEERVWVRRLILADLMRCYEAAGHLEQAGDVFLAIVASDPSTPAFTEMPLPWFADDRVSRAKAQAWLNAPNESSAQLLGASWLLMTTAGAAAQPALKKLAASKDTRIAALAEAQLWRAELIRATAADAEQWESRVEQMPESVRAGPYVVLGQLYDRLGQTDAAALAYLRVPLLYSRRRESAARALVAAARAVRRAGHADEATQLLSEAVADYRDTPHAAEAKQLLGDFQSGITE